MKLTAGLLRGNTMKKVITYGTFDLFHEGHYNILKRAKALGDYLIVGVTSESYDIERGKLNVRDSLLKRIENVRRTGFADEIIIEEYQGQKLSDIIKYKVDLLVLGSDWRGKFDYLKNYCDVVYLERTKNITRIMGLCGRQNMSAVFMWSAFFLRMQRQRSRFVTNMNWIPITAWRQIMGNGSRDLTAFCPR